MKSHLLGLFLIALRVAAQLRVLEPQSLSRQFKKEDEEDGKYDDVIPASTATFGTPTYGEFFMGQLLVMNTTGCRFDYGDQMAKYNKTEGIRTVLMVNRGDCSFVEKVLIAERAGADAVVIADYETSPWDASQIKRVIMADNGNGQRIRIPSILITNKDAKILAEAATSTPITVSMDWSLPQKEMVTVDFWYTSGSTEALRFLTNVEPAVKQLKGIVNFRPHIYVLRLTSLDPDANSIIPPNELIEERCLDGDPTLCTLLPDVSTTVTAEDVLGENSRQMCLMNLTSTPIPLRSNSARKVLYSDTWWEYIKEIGTFCPLKPEEQKGENRFGANCSINLMVKLGLNPLNISECVEFESRNLMISARENNAWGNLALRINGARFSGNLEPSLVFKAICSAFETEPAECKTAITELAARQVANDSEAPRLPSSSSSWTHTLTLMLVVILASVIVTYVYHAYKEHSRQQAIRQEVRMEVKSQLQDYYRIADPPLTRWNNQGNESRETEFSNLKFR